MRHPSYSRLRCSQEGMSPAHIQLLAGWLVDGFHNFFPPATAALLAVQLILQLAHKQIGARQPICTTRPSVAGAIHICRSSRGADASLP